jgi:hypothetical protein
MENNSKAHERDFPFTGREAAVILAIYALLTISMTVTLL